MSATQDWARKQKTGGDAYRKVLLRAIADYADWEEGTCWPSIDTLANDCECHPNTVRRRLHELEKLKFISLQKRAGSSYFITLVGYKEWHLGLPVTKIDTPTYQVPLPDGEGYTTGSPPLPTREDTPTCQVAEHYHLTNNLTTKLNKTEDSATTVFGFQKYDFKHLETVLFEAAGPCLADSVNCLGLLNLATPQMWLDSGADLHLDILPSLRAYAVKYRGRKIRTWDYFTEAIARCKAAREAGLPQPSVEKSERSFRSSARNYKSKNEMMEEALANLGKEEAKP